MDPVTVIVTALSAGAGVAAATEAVKDSYAGLKALVLRRIKDSPAGEVALVEHAKDPQTWSAPLVKTLAASGADQDQDVIAAAQRLLQLADPAGANAGRYAINITAAGNRSIAAHSIQGDVHTGDLHMAHAVLAWWGLLTPSSCRRPGCRTCRGDRTRSLSAGTSCSLSSTRCSPGPRPRG